MQTCDQILQRAYCPYKKPFSYPFVVSKKSKMAPQKIDPALRGQKPEKKINLRGSWVTEQVALERPITVWTARQIFFSNKKLIATLKNINLTQLKSVGEFQHLQSYKL